MKEHRTFVYTVHTNTIKGDTGIVYDFPILERMESVWKRNGLFSMFVILIHIRWNNNMLRVLHICLVLYLKIKFFKIISQLQKLHRMTIICISTQFYMDDENQIIYMWIMCSNVRCTCTITTALANSWFELDEVCHYRAFDLTPCILTANPFIKYSSAYLFMESKFVNSWNIVSIENRESKST